MNDAAFAAFIKGAFYLGACVGFGFAFGACDSLWSVKALACASASIFAFLAFISDRDAQKFKREAIHAARGAIAMRDALLEIESIINAVHGGRRK